MSSRNETFGRLLKGAINSIAAYEGKTAPAIEDELGKKLGVAGSAIQRYKSGFLPPESQAVQLFAEAAVRRGYLGRAWLVRFLQAARYPTAEQLIDQLTGPAPARAAAVPVRTTTPPTGTVVFLFTDVESSTQLWEQHPQEMQRALARHDAILNETITTHGGVVFKTVGDGFCAAFAIALDALLAALAAQRALRAEPWGQTGPIHVRMALHAGAAQERDGDYFGPALNRVARLCASAHGGQILLSLAAEQLVRDQLPLDTTLHDLGAHQLKDLTRPEHIFQASASDIPSEFPPIKTLNNYRTNLPAQSTSLIGRDVEVATVRDILRRADVRLVTLSGPGGIGKTRLALEVAAEVLDDFRDGVWFISLASITDSSLVATAIAQALGVQEAGVHSFVDLLKLYLREKALLLVLDNFEQVAGAASLIAELLAVAPALKLLVTSRSVLHLSGEHEFAVPPLELPDRAPLPPLERLTQYDAMQLFIERAQAARADFAVTNANAPAIAEICARLDGLPLAIELAAVRVKLFSPQTLLGRLTHRLALLVGGPHDLPARQQTLRGTITWSYDLLDAAEQVLFARLAVFVGGCTLEAVETICDLANEPGAINPPIVILEALSALIDKSLLRQMDDMHGEPRFVMLETIREYALERLAERGEDQTLRRRHTTYYVALAETADEHLMGPDQAVWIQRLDAEIDNLRAALAWLRSADSVAETGLQLVGALGEFWVRRGYRSEGRAWLADMLARPGAPTIARARALCRAGFLVWYQSDLTQAAALLEESLMLYRELGDRIGSGWALYHLGLVASDQDDFEQAAALFDESRELFRERGYVSGSAWVLLGMGMLALRQRDMERSEGLFTEGLALFRELGDHQGIALTLGYLGYCLTFKQDDLERATSMLEESLTLCRQLGSKSTGTWVLISLGVVAAKQRPPQPERAAALYTEGLAVFRELNERRGMSVALGNLGGLALKQGDYQRAAGLLAESLAICRDIGERRIIPGLLRDLGAAARAQGDHLRATAAFAESLTLSHSLGDTQGIAASLEHLAETAGRTGQSERAARLFGAASILREETSVPLDPQKRSEYDRAVAAARAQLGEPTFAAAWEAGRTLPLEQAIAEALGQISGSTS